MRTLMMLVLVVLAFFAVRWFAPSPETEAEEGAEPELSARFLPPPEAPREPAVAPAATPAELPLTETDAGEPWPIALVASGTPASSDEVRIAAAIVHGSPAQVQEASAVLARDRALLLESFAWELAGERQMALSLSQKVARDAIDASERSLFEAALTGRPSPSLDPAGSGPVALAMEMALVGRDADRALAERDFAAASRGYSRLLVGELGAPWGADPAFLARWTNGLDQSQREHRWNPRSSWPAVEIPVQRGDTLIDVRIRYLADRPGAVMCTGIIERANRLAGYLQPGQVLRVPTDAVRVLVDVGDRWLLFFLGDEVAAAWPVGVGRPGEDTPPGEYTARNKLENPPWMKEGQEPVPFGDPRNPLGTRWIGWLQDGGKTSYGFHGTWEPESIGKAASDGCVRLLNEDVEELFQILPEGAPILVRN